MFSKRILMLAGGCLLAASGAWADDLGYVDCSSHSDDTPVFTKARKSPDTVGTVACGERFTILLNGFIFSRIETKDGKVGYIYSNYISFDRGATAATIKQPDTGKVVEATSKVAIPAEKPAQPKPAPAQARPTFPQPAPAEQPAPQTVAATTPAAPDASAAGTAPASSTAPATNYSATQTSGAAQPPSDALAQTPAPATPPAPTEVVIPAPSKETPTASAPATTDSIATPPAPSTASAPASSPTEQPAPASPDSPVKTVEAQPAPQPQPAAAQPAPQPAPPPIRDARVRDSWEKPNPSARKPFAIELFGGFTYTRYVSGGNGSNFTGATGSIAWNFKPWLQIIGDSTYSYATISGTKNALYGNHYGPRYYFRKINRWNITPFVEGLIGGTRADTTVTGPGGYTTSGNCISYKVGGGVDMRTSRHIELRLFDVDYYRTAFGSNLQQSNYTVSTGLVLQLFGGDHQ